MPLVIAFHIIGPGIQRGHHDGVGITRAGGVGDLAHAVKAVADRSGLPQIAAAFGEIAAHVRGGAVQVVRHRLDDDGDAVDAIAFVPDFGVIRRVTALGFLDRAFDHVLGHRHGLRGLHGQTQAGVLVGIRIAHLGGDGDLLRQLGKHLRAQLVLLALAMLDVRPFRMACHDLAPVSLTWVIAALYSAQAGNGNPNAA